MSACRSLFACALAAIGLTVGLRPDAALAQSGSVPSISWIKNLSQELGKPLLSTAIDISNENRIVLQSLTAQSAIFLFGSKEPGEIIEALRKRAALSVILSTCSGNKDLEAPIASVSVWEELDERERRQTGKILKEVLELINDPLAISTPTTLRAPRIPNLVGPVFEYVRGDRTTVVGLLHDTGNDRLMLNWAISDASVCRKP